MRLRSVFLPASFCVLTLTVGMISLAAGNGVERSPWIEWEVPVPSPEPDVRKAIEKVIAEAAPELVAQSEGKNHLRVVEATDEIVPVDGNTRFGSVLELTMKVASRTERDFKLRVELLNKPGFLYENRGNPDEKAVKVQAKIVEWIGLGRAFGTNFGLPNAK